MSASSASKSPKRVQHRPISSKESTKQAEFKKEFIPGVGTYDIRGPPAPYTLGISMGYKLDNTYGNSTVPGPGTYNLVNKTIEKDQ